jgi:hypothetical protein
MAVKPILMSVLLLAAFGAGAGQIYKWVDAQGRYHYGDQPQPGWTPVEVKPIGGPAPERDTPTDAAPQPTTATGTKPGADDSAAREKLRAEECQRRKEQLDTYRRAPKIVERNQLGEEREFSEEQRLKLIEQTQRQVKELCGEDAGETGGSESEGVE